MSLAYCSNVFFPMTLTLVKFAAGGNNGPANGKSGHKQISLRPVTLPLKLLGRKMRTRPPEMSWCILISCSSVLARRNLHVHIEPSRPKVNSTFVRQNFCGNAIFLGCCDEMRPEEENGGRDTRKNKVSPVRLHHTPPNISMSIYFMYQSYLVNHYIICHQAKISTFCRSL